MMRCLLLLTPDSHYVSGMASRLEGYFRSNRIQLEYIFPFYVDTENICKIYPSYSGSKLPICMYGLGLTFCAVIQYADIIELKALKGDSSRPEKGTIRAVSGNCRKSFSLVHTFDSQSEQDYFFLNIFKYNLHELPKRKLEANIIEKLYPIMQLDSAEYFEPISKLREMIAATEKCTYVNHEYKQLHATALDYNILFAELINSSCIEETKILVNALKNSCIAISPLHAHLIALELHT